LKSSNHDLKKRGFINQSDIKLLENRSIDELYYTLLSSNIPTERTASIRILSETELNNDTFTSILLRLLCVEKFLYTKIEICKTLENGNKSTAIQMIEYLGKIGNNQHKIVPDTVSKKRSFPLPRDIIARTLGNMSTIIFPLLISVLSSNDISKISETLDAIGYMVFYNPELSTVQNAKPIYDIIKNYSDNPLLIWKSILCLSAFPLKESSIILENFLDQNNFLTKEARRSLNFIS